MAELGFDENYYLRANPDVQRAILNGIFPDAATHFRLIGAAEGRNPNAAFNAADYLAQNPDVRAAVAAGAFSSAWDHYRRFGSTEGRLASTDATGFDAKAYLTANPDVKAAGYTETNALSHYVFHGLFENRQGPALAGTVLTGSATGTAQDDRLIPAIGLDSSVRIDAGGQSAAGDTLVLTKDTAPTLTFLDLTRSADQNLTGEQAGTPTGPTLVGFENVDGSRALVDLTLTGLSQSDSVLIGGVGRDAITGGAGADVLSGNGGNDSLVGAGGADTLVGGIGNDTLAGGTGNDTLSDDGGDDQGFGDDGDDVIDLGMGRNRADGGAGNDTITANNGTETLTGGAGNDSFRLPTGALQSGDSIDGGAGQDALLLTLTATDTGGFLFDPSTGGALRDIDALVLMDMSGTSAAKQFRIVLTDGFLAANGRSDGLIIDARGLPNASQLVFDLSQLTGAAAGLLTSGVIRILASPTLEVRDQAQVLITSTYSAATGNGRLPAVSAFTLIAQTGITAGREGAYNTDRTISVPETVTPPTPPTTPVTPVTPTSPAQTLVLTTGLTDALTPAAGTNEAFTGGVGTLNGTDVVNGNGGADSLALSAQAGATINSAGTATVTDIDTVSIQTAASATLNGTGFTAIGEVIVTGTGALTVVTPSANLATNTPFVLGTGYAQTLTDASGLLTSYALDGSTAGAGISTTRATTALALRAASTLTTLTTGAGTVTLTGTGALTLGTVTGATQIDGSAMTGALTHTATAATVRSGSANDTITLGVADSRVDTGGGDDTVTGGANLTVADTILGGAGTDVMTLTARTANTDLDNVTGIETITFADGASYTYVISAGSAYGGDGTAVTIDASALTGGNALSLNANNTTGHAMTVTGGTGNDSVVGCNFADSLNGGDGDDTLAGVIGDDYVSGGNGNDRLFGHAGNDSLYGGLGNDSLFGGLDNDYLSGDDGDDQLSGDDGNDTLVAGAGSDLLVGGNNDDAFVMANNLTSADTITGGSGTDSLTVTARNADTDLDRVTQVETITLSDGASYHYVVTAGSDHATDSTGVTLNGSGLTGANALYFDSIGVTGHSVTVQGGAAADSIFLNAATTSSVNTGAGNDTITIATGATTLSTGTINGGSGSDTLALTGNTVMSSNLTNVSSIEVLTIANTTTDVGIGPVDGLVDAGATLVVTTVQTTGKLTFSGGAETDGHFNVTGGQANDALVGGTLVDTVDGGSGDDFVVGMAGDDVLRGDDGVDNLIGGVGNDTLTGGNGADAFHFGSADGAGADLSAVGNGVDTITDFAANDTLFFNISALSMTNNLGNMKIATLSSGGGTLTSLANTATAGDVDAVILLNTTGFASYAAALAELNATSAAITDNSGSAIVLWYSSVDNKIHITHDTDVSVGAGTGTEIGIIGNSTSAMLATLVGGNFNVIA